MNAGFSETGFVAQEEIDRILSLNREIGLESLYYVALGHILPAAFDA